MIAGLPVSSIPQCTYNHHDDAWLELFQAIGRFEPTFIQAKQASKMICNVRILKSRIKTFSFLEVIVSSRNDVFKDFESHVVGGIRKLGNSTGETAKSNVIVKHNAGSYILTLELQAKKSDL